LNGLNNVAPTELNELFAYHSYCDYAPMELKNENQTDQLVYQLYKLTEEEIKIIENAYKPQRGNILIEK
jgi:hypothetical protein